MLNKIITCFVSWFGLGFLKPGPGTWGTLGSLPLVWLLSQLQPIQYMFAVFIFVLVTIFVTQLYLNLTGQEDPKEVVIDEVAGFLISMTWLPFNVVSLGLAFVLFRLLDIFKPYPIRMVDEKVSGGLGVVADDILAGIITNFLLQIVYSNTNWLNLSL